MLGAWAIHQNLGQSCTAKVATLSLHTTKACFYSMADYTRIMSTLHVDKISGTDPIMLLSEHSTNSWCAHTCSVL